MPRSQSSSVAPQSTAPTAMPCQSRLLPLRLLAHQSFRVSASQPPPDKPMHFPAPSLAMQSLPLRANQTAEPKRVAHSLRAGHTAPLQRSHWHHLPLPRSPLALSPVPPRSVYLPCPKCGQSLAMLQVQPLVAQPQAYQARPLTHPAPSSFLAPAEPLPVAYQLTHHQHPPSLSEFVAYIPKPHLSSIHRSCTQSIRSALASQHDLTSHKSMVYLYI